MQTADILVNELQLGSQLANAVKQKRSSDFGLLLAMMSHNVLDHAAFCLPDDSPVHTSADEAQLRQQLGLAQPQVFSASENSVTQALLLGVDLHTEGLTEVKLKGYLDPEPLAVVDDFNHIPSEIIANCEPAVRQRYERKEDKVSEPLDHNPAGLYEVLQDMAA
ncbi:MAG: hypothetical protein ACI8WB_005117 [Phenylobacterium sp.]|jgi:hypothetical protein